MSRATVRGEARRLAGKSAVYAVGSFLLKGLAFLLLPLYTRFLSPADYGIIGVTTAITVVLGFLYPLGLQGALARLYFNKQDEAARRESIGTLWLAILLTAAVTTVFLDRVGEGMTSQIFRDIPFNPYVRVAVWTAFFGTFSLIPLSLFQIKERPAPYVIMTMAGSLLTTALVIWLVVVQRQGAFGYLLGTLAASGVMALLYVALMLRQAAFAVRWDYLKAALAYSLPLVPHSLAGWVLDLSDRTILERFVSLSQVGLYSLGYDLGGAVAMVASAINGAWVPYVFRIDAEHGPAARENIARLATYYVAVLSWVALSLSLLSHEVLAIMTAPAFHAADRVVPLVAGGLLLNGLYYIPINLLFVKSATWMIPLITGASAVVNVALNLAFVPQYGILAAAGSTLVSYAVMLILAWLAAQRVYPLDYEYGRFAKIAAAAALVQLAGSAFVFSDLAASIGFKLALLAAFPILLFAFRFFTPAERLLGSAALASLWRRTLGRAGRN